MPERGNLHELYSASQLVSLGLKLYKQGKYSEALEALNSAEEARNGGADLDILDTRAATHARLGQQEPALADARRMLILDKTYVPGYLRTGKVLESMDKADVALKIYERGIRYGVKSHSRFETLKKAHAGLKQQLAPPEGVNPFNALPVELLDMIFQYLPTECVCQCLRVCKQWNSVMTTWHRFWIHLDFSAARRTVAPATLMRYAAYARHGVKTAVLKNVVLQATPILSKFAGKCQDLESLTLLSGGTLKDGLEKALARMPKLRSLTLSPQVAVSLVSLKQVLNSNLTLTALCCGAVSLPADPFEQPFSDRQPYNTLQKWSIASSTAGIRTLETSCPRAPSLQSLQITLDRFSSGLASIHNLAKRHPKLETLEISCTLVNLSNPSNEVELPGSLRHLKLCGTLLFDAKATQTLKEVPNLTLLQSVILQEHNGLSFAQVNQVFAVDDEITDASQLETLQLTIPLWTKELVSTILCHPRLQELSHLALLDCREIDDEVATMIAAQGKKLKSLRLPSSRITGVGLKALVTACPSLAYINVDSCQAISLDAVQWAKGQGVTIAWNIAA